MRPRAEGPEVLIAQAEGLGVSIGVTQQARLGQRISIPAPGQPLSRSPSPDFGASDILDGSTGVEADSEHFAMRVKIDGLTKAYGVPIFGRSIALDNVSLEFQSAELIAIVGANGAGKTTLLKSLVGILSPTSGAVLLDNERFSRRRIDLRRRIAYLPDVPLFFANTTVLKHISLYVACYKAERVGLDEQIVAWLQEFALLPKIDDQISTLSRGEKYKAALIALLAVDAELWLIDEPFASGMDPEGLAAFRKAARMAVERGATVIYSTQILEVAERFADRVCILQSGRVRTCDSLERLREIHGIQGGNLEAIYRRISDTP